jgi:RNA polymerase sigma factor (TIGR02999 family)
MDDQTADRATGDVTGLLRVAQAGDRVALEQVYDLVYGELRQIAAARLRNEREGHTLQPTALVNEAFLKLAGSPAADVRDRGHFLGIAARAMRQVLVDHARRRGALKRGEGVRAATLTGQLFDDNESGGIDAEDLLALDAALDRLNELDPRLRQVVELRFFAGLNDTETGAVLGVTRRTVQRDWTRARAWLYRELYKEGLEPESEADVNP